MRAAKIMDFDIAKRKLVLAVSEHNSLRLHFDSASDFVLDDRVIAHRELDILANKKIVVTEVVVRYSNLGATPKALILSMHIEFAKGLLVGDRVMVFDRFDWIQDGKPEDKSDFWFPAKILDIRDPHHDIPQTVIVQWDHSKSASHGHRLENVRSYIDGDEDRNKVSQILKHVTITKFDLEGKENFYTGDKRFGLRHFLVVDKDGKQTFIRLSNADTPVTEELERQILEVEQFKVGDIVDVEVEPIEWKINDLSGVSYKYQMIRGA